MSWRQVLLMKRPQAPHCNLAPPGGGQPAAACAVPYLGREAVPRRAQPPHSQSSTCQWRQCSQGPAAPQGTCSSSSSSSSSREKRTAAVAPSGAIRGSRGQQDGSILHPGPFPQLAAHACFRPALHPYPLPFTCQEAQLCTNHQHQHQPPAPVTNNHQPPTTTADPCAPPH